VLSPANRKLRMRLELVRERMRRIRRGRIGSASRDSNTKKAANRTSDPPPNANVWTDTHPYRVASMMANVPSIRASVTMTEPATSTPPRRPSPMFSVIRRRPSMKVSTPTGTLMKKIQCHERAWVNTPPTSRPIDPPPTATKM
jgi:hypothetical protein